jgi:MFS family permease
MAAASGGLLFINGLGAIAGPIVVGWMLDNVGAHGFWAFIAVLLLGLATYAGWRMLRRPDRGVEVGDTVSYAPVAATGTAVAAEAAQEVYIEHEIEQMEEAQEDAA